MIILNNLVELVRFVSLGSSCNQIYIIFTMFLHVYQLNFTYFICLSIKHHYFVQSFRYQDGISKGTTIQLGGGEEAILFFFNSATKCYRKQILKIDTADVIK